MAAWPNAEKMVVAYLRQATGRDVSTRLPGDLEARAPLARVTRGPGSDDKVTDSFLIDCETFTLRAGTVDRWDFAEEFRQHMHALSGHAVLGALVDRVSTSSAPTFVDYGNDALDRLIASYRLELRKDF